ncbi:hypothetical protein DL96DRAFT_1607806 [Flagelloscypha sp. PMI_526]|nr:hypothetical protein DL96DRAFT_1607806 [Flagelloscypha sp. PMI_526]
MAPNPLCVAVANAKDKSGLSYADIATKIGTNEQHVIDICTATKSPTKAEFDALATTLGITDAPPKDDAHKVI